MGISFFTPIRYSRPTTWLQTMENIVEEYFYLGGATVTVILSKNGERKYIHNEQAGVTATHVILCALKVASYFRLTLLAFFMTAKVVFRCIRQHQIIDLTRRKDEIVEITPFPFTELPKELVNEVFKFLDTKALAYISGAAKTYREVVQSSPSLLSRLVLAEAKKAAEWVQEPTDYIHSPSKYTEALLDLLLAQLEDGDEEEVNITFSRIKEQKHGRDKKVYDYLALYRIARNQIKNTRLAEARITIDQLKQCANEPFFADALLVLADDYRKIGEGEEVEAMREMLKALEPHPAFYEYQAIEAAYNNDFAKCLEYLSQNGVLPDQVVSIFIKNKRVMIEHVKDPKNTPTPTFLRDIPNDSEIRKQEEQIDALIQARLVSSLRNLTSPDADLIPIFLIKASRFYRKNENLNVAQSTIELAEIKARNVHAFLQIANYHMKGKNAEGEKRIVQLALERFQRDPQKSFDSNVCELYLWNHDLDGAIACANDCPENEVDKSLRLIAQYLQLTEDIAKITPRIRLQSHQLIFEYYYYYHKALGILWDRGSFNDAQIFLRTAKGLLINATDPNWKFHRLINLFNFYKFVELVQAEKQSIERRKISQVARA